MDRSKIAVIRNVIRVFGFVCGGVAALLALVFGRIKRIDDLDAVGRMSTMCMIARICIIAMFVLAAALLVIDLVTKQFPISASGVGFVIALVGFIGNFIIAAASTKLGFATYIFENTNAVTGMITMTRLNIGTYMIMASGAFWIAYNAKFMKNGT